MNNTAPPANVPRVTIDAIMAKIKKTDYLRHGLTTFCVITLENGFTVTGTSACVSAANYNQGIGEKIAYENAFDEIWPLEGYLLREQLFRADLK
jgi:hypothetical protein